MFPISIVIFKLTLYFLICMASIMSTWFYFIFCAVFLKLSGNQFQLKVLLYECHKNSLILKIIRTDVKIRIFPILIAFSSGFGISKQNLENPNKIRIVGRSAYFYGALVQHPFHRLHPPPPPILTMFLNMQKRTGDKAYLSSIHR